MSKGHRDDPFISSRGERERELERVQSHVGANYDAGFGSMLEDVAAADIDQTLREHPLPEHREAP
jgi:hypothetical protein